MQIADRPKESEERYSAIFHEARDGIVLIEAETGRIADCNPQFEKMTGRPLSDLRQMKIWEIRPPDKRAEAREKFDEIVGKEYGGSHDFGLEKPDGTIVPIEFVLKRIDFQNKNLILSVDRDIAERKLMEEKMAEEAIRRHILIEQSRDGIVVLDQKGTVYEANKAFANMLGYSSEEVQELHVLDWDTQWTREQLLTMIHQVDASGAHFETRHRRKDGTFYDVEISTNGALWGNQKLVFCVCRDISQRKNAEKEIQKRVKDLEDFYEMAVSRELRMNELKEQIEELKEELSKYKKQQDK